MAKKTNLAIHGKFIKLTAANERKVY